MTTESTPRSAFQFPLLMTLTSILCLVSYQTFGLNTTIGVATATAALTLFGLTRKSNAAEANG